MPSLLSHTVKSRRDHEENAVTGNNVSAVLETLTVESARIVLIKLNSKLLFFVLWELSSITSAGFDQSWISNPIIAK